MKAEQIRPQCPTDGPSAIRRQPRRRRLIASTSFLVVMAAVLVGITNSQANADVNYPSGCDTWAWDTYESQSWFYNNCWVGTNSTKYDRSGNFQIGIQRILRQRGYGLTVDGIYGTGSATAMKSFQSSRGLSADGIVGRNTWRYLGDTLRYEFSDANGIEYFSVYPSNGPYLRATMFAWVPQSLRWWVLNKASNQYVAFSTGGPQ